MGERVLCLSGAGLLVFVCGVVCSSCGLVVYDK